MNAGMQYSKNSSCKNCRLNAYLLELWQAPDDSEDDQADAEQDRSKGNEHGCEGFHRVQACKPQLHVAVPQLSAA
jgi:hypothetical protein